METTSSADLTEFLDRVGTGCAGRVWECTRIRSPSELVCGYYVTNDPNIADRWPCHECRRMFVKCTCRDDPNTTCMQHPDRLPGGFENV